MFARIGALLSPPTFEDEAKSRAARLLNTILLALLGLLVLYAFSSLLYPQPLLTLFVVSVAISLDVVSLVLLRRGLVALAAGMFHSFLWLLITGVCILFGGVEGPAVYGYIVIVVMTGLLQSGSSSFGYAVLSVVTGLAMVIAGRVGLLPPPLVPRFPLSEWLALSTYIAISAAVAYLATSSLKQALERATSNERALAESYHELQAIRNSLEDRVVARTHGLETAVQVSRAVTSVLALDELLPQVVDVVRERFGLYYVGVFLLDAAGEWAVLRAGTGPAGRQMLDNGHRLAVGGSSMIGQCVSTGQARIALDVGDEAYRFDNPLLPETRSEMALPLRWREEPMGAMTVQSAAEAAFDDTDVALLQTVADQLAVAIRNAQLFAETQQALSRSESIVRRYVRESWDRVVELGTHVSGYRYSQGSATADEDAWLPIMARAVQERGVVASDGAGTETAIAVPLISSGEVIGAIGLRRGQGEEMSEEELAVIGAVGEQVAQAVERMRLLDETHRSAQRETILRQTADRIRSQGDLDAILKVAAQELRRVVGATRVSIRLGTELSDRATNGRAAAPDREE